MGATIFTQTGKTRGDLQGRGPPRAGCMTTPPGLGPLRGKLADEPRSPPSIGLADEGARRGFRLRASAALLLELQLCSLEGGARYRCGLRDVSFIGHAHGPPDTLVEKNPRVRVPPHSKNKNTILCADQSSRRIPAGAPCRVALARAVPATVAMLALSRKGCPERSRRGCPNGLSARGVWVRELVESSEIFVIGYCNLRKRCPIRKEIPEALARSKRNGRNARRGWRKSKNKQHARLPDPSGKNYLHHVGQERGEMRRGSAGPPRDGSALLNTTCHSKVPRPGMYRLVLGRESSVCPVGNTSSTRFIGWRGGIGAADPLPSGLADSGAVDHTAYQ